MQLDDVLGLPIPDVGPVFAAVLVLHIAGGLTGVVSGALAATARKRPGWHPRSGRVYLVALCVVAATAAVMGVIRFAESGYLLVLAVLLAGFGLLGWRYRPTAPRRNVRWHAVGMGGSFIVLLTGFYVDNGPHLPLWQLLPPFAFWVLPAVVGIPLIVLGLRRYRSGASR